ncbi:MAG: hypothetical protein P4K97_02305 [Terracidiphilus sp.]|nr:hypothetical protein [Terracidiphilus sp.]
MRNASSVGAAGASEVQTCKAERWMQQQPDRNEAAAVAIPFIRNWRREGDSIDPCIMDSP